MTASLTARIDALDDFTRKSLLKYLAGYAPAAVRAGLDEMDRQAAEQDAVPDAGESGT